MKVFKRIWLIGAVAVLCLTLSVSPVAAVTDGTADNGGHPNVGIMYMEDLPVLTYGMCSGSLLSADDFLVAGHCTALLSAYVAAGLLTTAEVFVSFDDQVDYNDTTGIISATHRIAVTGWDTHPGYVNAMGLMQNDVGVIHLATAQTITPIDLPEAGYLGTQAAHRGLVGHEFTDVGYGLNSLNVPLANPTTQWTWEHERTVGESTFVTLSSNNLFQDGGVCMGDSGGPHFWAEDSNLVVAVTSSGTPHCGTGAMDANQRLDLKSVLDWLEQYR